MHVTAVQVYGETSVGKESGCTETSTLEPTNPYSAAKAGAGDSHIQPMSSTVTIISTQHRCRVAMISEDGFFPYMHLHASQRHEEGSTA